MRYQHFFLFAFIFVCTFSVNAQTAQVLTEAASSFVETLSAEEKPEIVFDFADSARTKWTNLPVGMVPRPGVAYGALSDDSRIAFHHLLTSALSSQGYLKITSIMHLDDVLNELIQLAHDKGEMSGDMLKRLQNLEWGYGNFYVAIWGQPQGKTPWGLSFGGHHLAFSLTVAGESVSMTPLFMGSDPAEVKVAKYAGWRVLSKEEDYGFMMLNALSDAQQAEAIIKEDVPRDIITNPRSSQRITSYYGISVAEFDAKQKAILELLIQEYTHNLEHESAHRLYEQIMATGLDKVYFAWIGSKEIGKPHYYIINGPDFLIEYDNYPSSGNHIHLILREKDQDFGEDLLREHYLKSDHHK